MLQLEPTFSVGHNSNFHLLLDVGLFMFLVYGGAISVAWSSSETGRWFIE
jgi:hypothetical protein